VIARSIKLNYRATEDRFERNPHRLVRERAEPHDASLVVGANARATAGNGKALLQRGCSDTCA
jgi:hypothetical protein